MSTELSGLFASHLEAVVRRYETALAGCGYDAAVVAAGSPAPYARDDIVPPFRADPQFRLWCPAEPGDGSCVIHIPGRKPVLAYHQPQDFWHLPPQSPDPVWAEHFDVRTFAAPSALARIVREATAGTRRIAVLGDEALAGAVQGEAEPPALLARLDFERACKTPYELACLRAAGQRAARGHAAASAAFAAGDSEFSTHLAYLAGTRHEEGELPYPSIVAQNEHAAVLHYQHRQREVPADGLRTLLIDAGATVRGYAADVTRTHVAEPGAFADLVSALDALQRDLVADVAPGADFVELHRRAHLGIGRILADAGIAVGSPETLMETEVTDAFMPHGLGHLLGLQTHDVGGRQVTADGDHRAPPARWEALRLTRPLAPEMVLTIEPGLYFIPMLLDALRRKEGARMVDFERVEQLRCYGGVRIEDDVRVTRDGAENLTRAALEAGA